MFDFKNANKDIKLKFRLAPMIHIGARSFYKTVMENIKNCDEIFYEGVALIDREGPFYKKINLKNFDLTFNQYKRVADKLGLVTQNECFNLNDLGVKLTHVDYDEALGEAAWRNLHLKEKIKLSLIKPLQLFILRKGISRFLLAKSFMISNQEAYLAYGPVEDEPGTSRNFVMNEREQIIFKEIRERIKKEGHIDKTIAIVYGAGHMNSIARFLIDQFRYVPFNGKFMRVFDVV
jgi:hypothetical protein